MDEWGKYLFHSKYERACASQDTTISNMKEIVEIYKFEIEEICAINRDMRGHIDSCHNESQRREVYTEQSTTYFEDVANITGNSDILIK